MKLLTNNPAKRVGLDGYGLQIVERVPLHPTVHDENRSYLETKRDKMGHILDEMNDANLPEPVDEQIEEQNEDPENGAL
jgi:3,4-dihydroxy 2-butanone 4-phosphate synthase/GTP cyclohydrolase II